MRIPTKNRPACLVETRDENGSILVWALVFVIITAGMVVSHSIFMVADRREIDVRHSHTALARNFAQSGLRDATSWFARQDTQPVTAFDPKLDRAAAPPIVDTIDPGVGLVREFEIDRSLWGRYEVRRGEARDVSSEHGLSQSGRVWDLACRAYLYRTDDPDAAFDPQRNPVLATTAIRSEIRGVPLQLPASAGLIIDDPLLLHLQSSAILNGGAGAPGFAYPAGTPNPASGILGAVDSVLNAITGFPPAIEVPGFDASPSRVFSMSLDALRDFSDILVGVDDSVPPSVPDDSILFFDGDLNLEANERLTGRMALIVAGDLNTAAGSTATLQGMTYVAGDVEIRGQFSLEGTFIARGQVRLGGATDPVRITYDEAAVNAIRNVLSSYRMSRQTLPLSTSPAGDVVGDLTPGIDPSATISPSATIEAGVTIGPNCVVGANAHIKSLAVLKDNVKIGAGSIVGVQATLSPNVTIGTATQLGDRISISPTVMVGNNVRTGSDVQLQSGVVIESGVTLGHGARVRPNSIVRSGSNVGDRANIGPNGDVPSGTNVAPDANFK